MTLAQDVVSSVLTMANVSEYASLSGTPVAGSVGVGAVALLWSARPDLVRQVEKTIRVIQENADPKVSGLCDATERSPNYEYGYGNLNIGAAFDERTNVYECLQENVVYECAGCQPTTDECVREVASSCCVLPGCFRQREEYFETLALTLNETASWALNVSSCGVQE